MGVTLIDRAARVVGIKGVYPDGTGAMNASTDVPEGSRWRVDPYKIRIPAGRWHVKIIGVPDARARFYTKSSEWIDYTGTLDTVVETSGADLQRLWAADGKAVKGQEVTAILTKLSPPPLALGFGVGGGACHGANTDRKHPRRFCSADLGHHVRPWVAHMGYSNTPRMGTAGKQWRESDVTCGAVAGRNPRRETADVYRWKECGREASGSSYSRGEGKSGFLLHASQRLGDASGHASGVAVAGDY